MPTRLELLQKMVAAGPNDPFPYYGLALEFRSQSRWDEAIATFQSLREKFPNYVPQYLMAGQILTSLDRRDEARTWLEQGIAAARTARDSHALGELQGALAGLG